MNLWIISRRVQRTTKHFGVSSISQDTRDHYIWVTPSDPHHASATYNVQIEWETSEVTYEPLDFIAANDPITCAVYARDNDLLDQPGWKHFKKLATREKQLLWLIREAKMHSYKSAP